MKAFRVLGTNHTSFTVSSLDRTIAFFRDCLGFDLVSRAPRGRPSCRASPACPARR